MLTKKPADRDQVAAATAALRSFWETGRSSWDRVQATVASTTDATVGKKTKKKPKKTGYVHGNKVQILKKAADEEGINSDTLKKSWRVAQLYTKEQIEELCQLIERHSARFGATHLTRIMAVKDAKTRDSITRKAIRARWEGTRLERTVQAANGRRRPAVGKKPAVPDSEPELLAALDALCDKWVRWCEKAGDDIPDQVRDTVDQATTAVNRVKKRITKMLDDSDKAQ